jgi:signal transduction histidine kinase
MDAQENAHSSALSSAESEVCRGFVDTDELRSILSNLSRELCRPLMSLRAGFDLLLAEANPSVSTAQRGHVRTMTGLCDDLLRLTRTYLDYAGLAHGTHSLNIGTFTLGALIDEVDRQSASLAAAQGTTWSCVLEGRDATVSTDASRCQQVLGNLVANALKHTGDGGEVRVVAKVVGPSWRVTVTDDGPGIPDEHLDRVFEPFYRVPRSESSPAVGDGLGLAVCRELVEQLGGSIALSAAPGGGLRATVELPTHPADNSGGNKRFR